jgi:O-antigen/teichoic acid export membrane protein
MWGWCLPPLRACTMSLSTETAESKLKVDQPTATAEVLSGAPASLRANIVTGMRWTLWLSILSLPLSYGTTILLARVSPEVIGTYGLLTIYIGLTSVFFFLGGNAVPIRFFPGLSAEKRLAFLVSYLLIIVAVTLPCQLVGSLRPSTLRYLFGTGASAPFQVLILWLAPIYIGYSLVLAALKGMMEIKWAQLLTRIVTVGSFAVYTALFLVARQLLVTHYNELVWGIYLGLALLATVIAIWRLWVLNGWKQYASGVRFFLPDGFWHFTLGLQASSILSFLSRLDYIFILNAGGLSVLGRYVALMTLVSAVSVFATFILDSFLPSLTNTLAAGDLDASRRTTEIYLRIMLPCGLGAACLVLFFADPLIHTLGGRYQSLAELALIAVPFAAVQVLNWFVGTMLSAIGQPHRDAMAKAFRTAVFCVSFWLLWAHFNLLGAVCSWALSEVSYQALSLYLLLHKMPFKFALSSTYGPFLIVVFSAAFAARLIGGHALVLSSAAWLASILCFGLMAKFTLREARALIRIVLVRGSSL